MLRIKDFATLCGCSVHTLRYYDEVGLLKPKIVNGASGYRYYDAQQVRYYQNIKEFQEIGFSVHEIKQLNRLTSEQIALHILEKTKEFEERLEKCYGLYKKYKEEK